MSNHCKHTPRKCIWNATLRLSFCTKLRMISNDAQMLIRERHNESVINASLQPHNDTTNFAAPSHDKHMIVHCCIS